MDLRGITDYDIKTQFMAFLRNNNIEPAENIDLILDGEKHRFRVRGDRNGEKSGTYCIHTDNIPAGWAEDWHVGESIKWCYDISGLPKEQQDYLNDPKQKAESAARRKKREEKQREKQIKAADSARIMIETLPDADENHPYLKAKHVYPYGIKRNADSLAVPLRDIDGNVKSLQWISKEGKKRPYKDTLLKGLFWSIGLDLLDTHPEYPILLGEGYATMAKVYELTGYPCVAAVSCGQLKNVAELLKGKYTKSKIIITADNDKGTELRTGKNPGLSHADDAHKAKLVHDIIYPEFEKPEDGSDWDDFAIIHGDNKTADILAERIKWACSSDDEKREIIACKELSGIATTLDKNIQIPPEDFIGGMFPRKRISAVIAAPGTGKTWLLQKFVSDLSVGGLILDGFAEEETPKKSLVFAGEAGPALMIRRAADTRWHVNTENINIYGMIDAEKKGISVMLDEDEGQKNIERAIKIHKPDIIWFDTLSSFHNKDENKSSEMKPIFRWLLTVAEVYDVAIVLMHHSRKRQAKERKFALTQDDVIGSSIFNRLVSIIISIEPTEDDPKKLKVQDMKSWFPKFIPFTYKLAEGNDEHTIMEVDLAPEDTSNTKSELWNYIRKTYAPDQWFKASDLHQAVKDIVNLRQVQRYLAAFVTEKKIRRRGQNKWVEYSVINFYSNG